MTTNSKHTPGPWAICDDGINVFAPDTDTAITNQGHVCAPDHDEAGANARLIARAPDLLAENEKLRARVAELGLALQTMCDLWQWVQEGGNKFANSDSCKSHYADARAALAKVTP